MPSTRASGARHAGGRGEVHDERRQGEHHAGGQIDLAHDHQHDLAARDDRGRRDVLREVLQAGAAQQEVAVGGLEIGDQQHSHDKDAGLLPPQEALPHPLRGRPLRGLADNPLRGRSGNPLRGWAAMSAADRA
jgi:hypothetical protein